MGIKQAILQSKANQAGMSAIVTWNGATNKWRLRCTDTNNVVEGSYVAMVKFIEDFFA